MMNLMKILCAAPCLAATAGVAAAQPAAPRGSTIVAESSFDDGLDGWTATAPTLSWAASDGNPGGFAQFTDNNSVGTWFSAPPAFHGDLRALDAHGSIRFDYRIIATGGFSSVTDAIIMISGPGGSAQAVALDLPPATTPWVPVEVALEESAWTVTQGTWIGLLADVTQIRITADPFFTSGSPEVIGLDNVRLVRTCPADVNGDGVLDFFDVQAFLNDFATQAEPGDWNDDSLYDFFDVQAFLNDYSDGCP